jgi:hypothetical protein
MDNNTALVLIYLGIGLMITVMVVAKLFFNYKSNK